MLLLILCKTLIETYIIRYYKYNIRYTIGNVDYKTRRIEG